jgi:CRP/FNR family transcriptional regulator, cyclic AMP receptor protein
MASQPEVLKSVPLFSLLDMDEIEVLAQQVEIKNYAPRERVYKMGDAGQAYVMLSGRARVTTVDEDQQEVVVDEPSKGEFFGLASMLEQTPHRTRQSRWKSRRAWKCREKTSPFCCSGDRTPEWTC